MQIRVNWNAPRWLRSTTRWRDNTTHYTTQSQSQVPVTIWLILFAIPWLLRNLLVLYRRCRFFTLDCWFFSFEGGLLFLSCAAVRGFLIRVVWNCNSPLRQRAPFPSRLRPPRRVGVCHSEYAAVSVLGQSWCLLRMLFIAVPLTRQVLQTVLVLYHSDILYRFYYYIGEG